MRQGGHDIPEATVRRRFEAGKRLFATVYQPLVDHWVLYDNAGDEPALMEWSGNAMRTPGDVKEPEPIYGEPQPTPAELKGSLAAIRRAANRAREIAQQTGTDLIVMRAGRVMRISPSKKQA